MIRKFAATLLLVLLTAAFYFTPHYTVHQMKAALDASDSAKLAGYIDFPALKESVKSDINAQMGAKASKTDGMGAFAMLLGAALLNPMVDAVVSPAGLSMMMKGRNPVGAASSEPAKPADPDVTTSMGYEHYDRFVVKVQRKEGAIGPTEFVFQRKGLFSWQLAGLRLPR